MSSYDSCSVFSNDEYSNEYSSNAILRLQRTQTFKKLAMSPQALYNKLATIHPDLADSITDVRRDVMDRKRLHVTYATLQARRSASSRGFALGEIEIPPLDGDFKGYIPYTTPCLGNRDLKTLLATYGEVTHGSFRTLKDGKTKTDGYDFTIKLKPNVWMPNEIAYQDDVLTIYDRMARIQCLTCYKYGHTQKHCRQRNFIQPGSEYPKPATKQTQRKKPKPRWKKRKKKRDVIGGRESQHQEQTMVVNKAENTLEDDTFGRERKHYEEVMIKAELEEVIEDEGAVETEEIVRQVIQDLKDEVAAKINETKLEEESNMEEESKPGPYYVEIYEPLKKEDPIEEMNNEDQEDQEAIFEDMFLEFMEPFYKLMESQQTSHEEMDLAASILCEIQCLHLKYKYEDKTLENNDEAEKELMQILHKYEEQIDNLAVKNEDIPKTESEIKKENIPETPNLTESELSEEEVQIKEEELSEEEVQIKEEELSEEVIKKIKQCQEVEPDMEAYYEEQKTGEWIRIIREKGKLKTQHENWTKKQIDEVEQEIKHIQFISDTSDSDSDIDPYESWRRNYTQLLQFREEEPNPNIKKQYDGPIAQMKLMGDNLIGLRNHPPNCMKKYPTQEMMEEDHEEYWPEDD